MKAKVDIAIACAAQQNSKWWGNLLGVLLLEQQRGIEIGQILAVSSALPDFNKSNIIGGGILPAMVDTSEGCAPLADENEKKRNQLTDANRGPAAKRFLGGSPDIGWKADWVFWIDDDTVIPKGAISKLLSLDKPAVAGLYFNPNPPKNPIAYIKRKDDYGYDALYDYPMGSLIQVDSVGLGCTLIHRSVFETIQEQHQVFVRPNGSLMPVHKSKISTRPALDIEEGVYNNTYCLPVRPVGDDDNRAWPFFSMEYGRTEDHHFWELARACGIRPWVDTTIVCGHIKSASMEYADYKNYLNEKKGLV